MKKIFNIIIGFALITSCSTKEEKDISFEGVIDFDFTQTVHKARKEGKTILIYFSSIACVNCRTMEEKILTNPDIKKTILKNYIFIPLIVDERASAEKKYWKPSMFSDDTLKRIGEINSQFQIELTQSGSQPKFAIVSNEKKVLSTIDFTRDRNEFLNFLE